MKKVYILYAKIPIHLFDSKMYQFVHTHTDYILRDKYYIGLYAWTTNKILLDTFMDFRKNALKMYKLIIRKFSKDEFHAFKKENFYEELSYYKIPASPGWDDDEFYIGWIPSKTDTSSDKHLFFSDSNKAGQIVCTRQEFTQTMEYGHDYLFEYMTQIINADYCAFKNKYIQALDYIGYCDEFNNTHDDPDDNFYFDRYESTGYSKSYGLSYHGHKAVDIYGNKLSIFINIFYEMIVGYDETQEIKMLIYN